MIEKSQSNPINLTVSCVMSSTLFTEKKHENWSYPESSAYWVNFSIKLFKNMTGEIITVVAMPSGELSSVTNKGNSIWFFYLLVGWLGFMAYQPL